MQFYNLFEAFGIELEYMIVGKDDLNVQPITDRLFEKEMGKIVSDVPDGVLEWSNELVLHVVELKVAKPVKTLAGLSEEFHRGVQKINNHLKSLNAKLLPTAMHPFMNPMTESQLWPHDNNDVYAAYNRIFDCRGHGWSNLQSTHINLPFADDAQFKKLHAAIRCVLPFAPALAASSPFYEGKKSAAFDSRLEFYQQNQKKVPEIAGKIIPESVEGIDDYQVKILKPIYAAITPFDQDDILKEDWLNSRGSIARFGRQTIEIRLLDINESPMADMAIAQFMVHLVKYLCAGDEISLQKQMSRPTDQLRSHLDRCIRAGDLAEVSLDDTAFWGAPKCSTTHELLQFLVEKTRFRKFASDSAAADHIDLILNKGCLSRRMLGALNGTSRQDMTALYQKLAKCLEDNTSLK